MSAVIFSGAKVKSLKNELQLNTSGASVLSRANVDPRSSAISAEAGSILMDTTTGRLYRKLDSGSSTNWELLRVNEEGDNLIEDSRFEVGIGSWTVYSDIVDNTLTSAAGLVDETTNLISHTSHGYRSGQLVQYLRTGGSDIGGLTNNEFYYIYAATANTFGLATSRANGLAGTLIDLTSDGTGAGHRFLGWNFGDGTGGSPSTTATRNTTTPLRGLADLTVEYGAGGEGVSIASRTIPRLYRGKSLYCSMQMDLSDSDYVADDLRIYAYDVTNDSLMYIQPVTGCSKNTYFDSPSLMVGKGVGQVMFTIPTESTTAQIKIGIQKDAFNTASVGYTCYIDDVKLMGQSSVPGAIIGEWTSWTPTGSWTANSTYTGLKRRVGGDMEYQVKIALSGAPTAANLTVNLPSGDVIDTGRMIHTTAQYSTISGSVGAAVDAGTNGYQLTVCYNNTTSVALQRNLTTGASGDEVLTGNAVHATEPFTFGNGDSIHFFFKVPIVGLTSSAALSTAEAQLVNAKLSLTKSGTQSVASAASTKVTSWTVNKDNLGWWDTTNNRYRVMRSGRYLVAGSLGTLSFSDEKLEAEIFVNGASSKVFGATSANPNITFSVALDLNLNDYVELNVNSTADTAYDVNVAELTITEIPDLSVYAVYGSFELLTTSSSQKTPAATGQYQSLTGNSLSLTPGTWRLFGSAAFSQSGAATYSFAQVGWYAANGADSGSEPALISTATGLTVLSTGNTSHLHANAISSSVGILPAASLIVKVSQSVTVYMVTSANMTTAANARINVYANAERLQ